jgi:hypothetical protein
MKSIEVILAVAFVAAIIGAFFNLLSSICLAATTDISESDTYILKPGAKDELIAFVNEARDFVV